MAEYGVIYLDAEGNKAFDTIEMPDRFRAADAIEIRHRDRGAKAIAVTARFEVAGRCERCGAVVFTDERWQSDERGVLTCFDCG